MLRAASINELVFDSQKGNDGVLQLQMVFPFTLRDIGVACKRGSKEGGVSLLPLRMALVRVAASLIGDNAGSPGSDAPAVRRGGATKCKREAQMVQFMRSKLGDNACTREDCPRLDAGALAWRAFASRVRQDKKPKKLTIQVRKSNKPTEEKKVPVRTRPKHHEELFKKHQLYSKYLPEFTQLSLEELDEIGPIPSWESSIRVWRDWARHMRVSLDSMLAEESLFRQRANEY